MSALEFLRFRELFGAGAADADAMGWGRSLFCSAASFAAERVILGDMRMSFCLQRRG